MLDLMVLLDQIDIQFVIYLILILVKQMDEELDQIVVVLLVEE